MEFGKFLNFIYLSSFTLSADFPYQLVTDMSEPVLKSRVPSGNGSMMMVIFLHKMEECFSYNS